MLAREVDRSKLRPLQTELWDRIFLLALGQEIENKQRSLHLDLIQELEVKILFSLPAKKYRETNWTLFQPNCTCSQCLSFVNPDWCTCVNCGGIHYGGPYSKHKYLQKAYVCWICTGSKRPLRELVGKRRGIQKKKKSRQV